MSCLYDKFCKKKHGDKCSFWVPHFLRKVANMQKFDALKKLYLAYFFKSDYKIYSLHQKLNFFSFSFWQCHLKAEGRSISKNPGVIPWPKNLRKKLLCELRRCSFTAPKNAIFALFLDIKLFFTMKKSRIRETKNPSTDADSGTDTILKRLRDLSKKNRMGRGQKHTQTDIATLWKNLPRADSLTRKAPFQMTYTIGKVRLRPCFCLFWGVNLFWFWH